MQEQSETQTRLQLQIDLWTRFGNRIVEPFLRQRAPFACVRETVTIAGYKRAEFLSFRGDEVRSTGEAIYMEEIFRVESADSGSLEFRVLSPDTEHSITNTILLIPTMRGVWFDYALLIGILLRKQFRIAVFDAHGCGCNASLAGIKFEPFLKDICTITENLRAHFSGSLCAFGSSLGGIVSLCLLAAGVKFDSLVAEGCSVTSDGGLVGSFSDEPPSVQAYYLVFYRAAIEHIRANLKSVPTRIALTWGERDNFIKAPERVEAINFMRERIGEPAVREAANGTHYPQIGFPMEQHEIDDYLTFITDFFKGTN